MGKGIFTLATAAAAAATVIASETSILFPQKVIADSDVDEEEGLLQLSLWQDYRRTFSLWKGFGPIISHYRLVEFKHKVWPPASKEEEQEEWQNLHNTYADQVLDRFKELRGFYIKVGQMLANRNDDLPSLYVERLRTLEDAVPAKLDGAQARAKVIKSLGISRLEDVFSEFEDVPIGSASIGQVHRARLSSQVDPGTPLVAIKIQSPGAEALFRADVKRAKQFCKVFAPEQVIIFDEIERQFLTEFDYRREAEHLSVVRENMIAAFGAGEESLIKVPKPYPKFCAKQVLTMEFLHGTKLVDGARIYGREYAKRMGTTLEALETAARDKIRLEGLPPPYNGPPAWQIDLYSRAMRVKDFIFNIPKRLYNFAIFPVLSNLFGLPVSPLPLSYSFVPLNTARIMDLLLAVHGHQLFVNGYFNADPHPGNFLLLYPKGAKEVGDRNPLLSCSNPVIGLLDYGQVKQLKEWERLLLSEVYIALADGDKAELLRLSKLAGYRSKYNDADVLFAVSVIGLDQDGAQVTGGLNIQQYMDKLFATDPWDDMLDVFVMPSRMSLLLRGVGLMLNHPVSVAKAWRPIAAKLLQDYRDRHDGKLDYKIEVEQ